MVYFSYGAGTGRVVTGAVRAPGVASYFLFAGFLLTLSLWEALDEVAERLRGFYGVRAFLGRGGRWPRGYGRLFRSWWREGVVAL